MCIATVNGAFRSVDGAASTWHYSLSVMRRIQRSLSRRSPPAAVLSCKGDSMSSRAAVLLRFLVLLGLVAPGSLGVSPFSTETSQAHLAAPAASVEAGDPLFGSRHAGRQQSRKQQGRNAERHARDANRRQDGRRPMEIPSGRLPAAVTAGPGETAAAAADRDAQTGQLSAEDRYIVVLEESAGNSLRTASAVASDSDTAGVVPTHVYHNVFNGFAAVIPDQQLAAVRGDPRVKAVVPDRVVRAN